MRYGRPLIIGLLALAGLVATEPGQVAASSFNPSSTYSLSDSSPGVNTNITSTFNLPQGDANFELLLSFTPPEWGIAADQQVADGAIVRTLTSQTTLGIINGACNNVLPIEFTMMDATTDSGITVPFSDPDDDVPGDLDDQFDIGSDGLPLGVTRYPEYLTLIFPGLTPINRAYGQTIVAGSEWSRNVLMFEPGSLIQTSVGPVATDPMLGYPSVTILQNGREVPSAVTDVCTPFVSSTTRLGVSKDNGCTDTGPVDPVCELIGATVNGGGTEPDEGGQALLTNPGIGTYNFVVYSLSRRDADNDGFENSIDTCALTPNVGDPRVSGDGDFDGDGLDAACDPNDANTNSDEDLDGYLNRQDNCPLVTNGQAQDNQADVDNDSIGNACDPNPDTPDGHVHVACSSDLIVIGAGGTAPPEPNVCDETGVGIDLDSNGVFDSLETDSDGDGFLDSVDGCPATPTAWPTPFGDPDCDGFKTADENFIGTDPNLACGANAWPPDHNDDGLISISDVLLMKASFGAKTPDDPIYDARRDLNPDGKISISDVLTMREFFDQECT